MFRFLLWQPAHLCFMFFYTPHWTWYGHETHWFQRCSSVRMVEIILTRSVSCPGFRSTTPENWGNGLPTWSGRTGLRTASRCCASIISRSATSTEREKVWRFEKTPSPPYFHPVTARRKQRFYFPLLSVNLCLTDFCRLYLILYCSYSYSRVLSTKDGREERWARSAVRTNLIFF